MVATDLGRDSPLFRLMNSRAGRIALSSPRRGAEPLLHLATIADPQAVNGTYFNRLKPEEPVNGQARDPGLARQLWERSAALTGLELCLGEPDLAGAGRAAAGLAEEPVGLVAESDGGRLAAGVDRAPG